MRALIPALGFVVAYGPMRIYTPLNLRHSPPEGSIKVLSYNIYNYLTWESADAPCPIADYILREDADIVCLVEAAVWGPKERKLDSLYAHHYQYRDSSSRGGGNDRIDILSRYPIVGKERIYYASGSNHSVAFRLKTGADTVTVIANHFQSIGFSEEDKSQFKHIVKGEVRHEEARQESRRILRKLAEAAIHRRTPRRELHTCGRLQRLAHLLHTPHPRQPSHRLLCRHRQRSRHLLPLQWLLRAHRQHHVLA